MSSTNSIFSYISWISTIQFIAREINVKKQKNNFLALKWTAQLTGVQGAFPAFALYSTKKKSNTEGM